MPWCPVPHWEPLMNTLMGLFMFMECRTTSNGVQIYCYKHILTRRYLNLDSKGQAYRYENGYYRPIKVLDALDYVFS